MPRRKDRFGYGVTLSASTVRLIDAAAEIMGEPDAGEMAFLHTVLAQCGLPYRNPKTRDYIRQNGRASLIVSAGYLLDPEGRQPVLQGVPYGAKPRLLMIHLCTEAMRTKCCFRRKMALAMTFNPILSVKRKWRRLDGLNQLSETIEGAPLRYGMKQTKYAA
jgi:hypothetical protein